MKPVVKLLALVATVDDLKTLNRDSGNPLRWYSLKREIRKKQHSLLRLAPDLHGRKDFDLQDHVY